MLRPIPARILRSTAEVQACVGTDMYQRQVFAEYTVQRVHLQPTDRIVKSSTNTDQQLSSVLFVDARRSLPQLDWRGMLQAAHDCGGDVRVTIRGVTYTVASVDELRDDTDRLHHLEIGLY